ncbi:YfgM family protein [Halomonas caseinilytica]|uniref:Ancillary SecYEG translocon subunit n=1 Tax=Halomonas caseinilytica TaxID=438744 RepID=A0A1M6VJ52_9GAMM|nr:tetratricopeptide repeat protein [Halomonas caseinilytica]SEN04953.1 Putative negative regulator of RcsB-dependent stress response [Halomonas caseinilytica]SHK81498.1 Putative negative regulator of RcsB-dependent stress response [Halomonas caseinilytica]
MAELRTEEEQIEAIKRWWKENGVSLLIGAAIAAAGVFAWKAWQDYQTGQAEAASQRYQQLLTLSSQDQVTDAARGQAEELVASLTEEHGDSLYADMARLLSARLSVEGGDQAAARETLEALIADSEHAYLTGLARLRLARLQVAADEPEAALDTLDGTIPATLSAQQADIRGDAHFALGETSQARDAWREALQLAEEGERPLYGVQLKLDNLGVQETTS